MTHNILRIDASARTAGSVTRDLNDQVVNALAGNEPVDVVLRDLTNALPQVTEDWVGANFTASEDRDDDQRRTLELSDSLVAELRGADTLVIGLPIYNFGVPASLKAWVDLIARVGETFRYTENGPVGLLSGKRAIVAVSSGGTKLGSDIDFATGYLAHVLGFIGISDVTFVTAETIKTVLPVPA